MMDRLLTLVLMWLLATPAYGRVENFQELLAASAAEEAVVYHKIHTDGTGTQPAVRPVKAPQKDPPEFKIRLIRRPLPKRTFVAKRST